MFSLKTGMPGAYTTTDDLNETAKMDEETRKATLMTLITSRAVPSALQTTVGRGAGATWCGPCGPCGPCA
jgi:hypothetical protein